MNTTTQSRKDILNTAFRNAINECRDLNQRRVGRPLSPSRYASVIRSTVTLELEGRGYRYDELWTGVDTVMNGLRRTGRIA